MILNTNILPNKVVNTTVTTAVKPNDSTDLCHKIMPGIVANKLNTSPSGGNICKAKATTTSVIILSIVALGYIFENKFATPILFLIITFILTSLKLLYNYCQLISIEVKHTLHIQLFEDKLIFILSVDIKTAKSPITSQDHSYFHVFS